MKRGRKRAMRIVPRVVFGTIVVGVVPAVAASCTDSPGTTCSGPNCNEQLGVAAVAFQCFDGSTAPQCHQMGVAAVAFQCFDGSTAPQCQPLDSGQDVDAADAVGDVEMG